MRTHNPRGPQAAASPIPKSIWVRPKEACEIAGVGLTTLYKLIGQGRVESKRVEGYRIRLIRRSSLENLGADGAEGC
jgi:excisionase family DNA binding protein